MATALGTAIGTAGLANADLIVANYGGNDVLQFDSAGNSTVLAAGGGLGGPYGLALGPDGNLYVSGVQSGTIERYNAATGAFVPAPGETGAIFATGSLVHPEGLAFSPSGVLFVSDIGTGEIDYYNIVSGQLLGTINAEGNPKGMVFGPDGNLYVSIYSSANGTFIEEFNGITGSLVGVFATGNGIYGTGFDSLAFGPDGNLYVSDHDFGTVVEFNGTTGAYIKTINTGVVGGIAFASNGNILVSDYGDNTIVSFDPTTGTPLGVFASGGGLNDPGYLLVTSVPEPTGLTLAVIGGLCLLFYGWRQRKCQRLLWTVRSAYPVRRATHFS